MEEKSWEDVLVKRKQRKDAKQSKKQSSINKQDGNFSNSTNKSNVPKFDEKCKQERVKISPESDEKKLVSANESQVMKVSKSKKQLKAERRAIQEAQRIAKAQMNLTKNTVQVANPNKTKVKSVLPPNTTKEKHGIKTNDLSKVKMFSHLYIDTNAKKPDILEKYRSEIHTSVIKLGLQYKNKVIIGSNARVIAFLNTLKQVLSEYSCERNFTREFEVVLECTIQYLRTCRPPSVSMTNAVKFLKWHLVQLPNNISSSEAQLKLHAAMEDYLFKIDKAGEAISVTVQRQISQNDVILTFGFSSLIGRILQKSFETGIKFHVIIADAGPLYEGKQTLRKLAKMGLHCTYVLLSAVSYIIKDATKVLLGAHALLTNGYVMSRAGSSQIALIARSYNVPVLVCCETHKFSECVQTDALVYNELGDPLPLAKIHLSNSNNYVKSLTLMYDITPSDLVTAVVTELAILPCTSVPVVLRVKPANSTLN